MGRWLVLATMLAACNFALPAGGTPPPGDTAPPVDLPPVTPQWAFKRTLAIDNTGLSAHTGFPLAVILDATRINYAATQAGGADLRFADTGGATLAHEIERWDPAGRSIVWVNVPAIAANGTTDIEMFYGNPTAPDGQNAAAVWDASYLGVWHLADAHDSTGRLTSNDVGSTPVEGQLAGARQFDGNGQYIDTGTMERVTQWTVEAWMNPSTASAATGAGAVVSGFPNYSILWNCNTSTFCHTVLYNDPSNTHFVSFDATVSAWTYVVGVFDGNSLRAYSNGNLNSINSNNAPVSANFTAKIGTHPGLNGDYNGAVDEVRISRTARAQDHVAAQLRSMTDAYVSYGPEQPN